MIIPTRTIETRKEASSSSGAAKYVAKLRALKTNDAPLLFKINLEAGHGGASGRYDYLKETSLDYAFILTHLP